MKYILKADLGYPPPYDLRNSRKKSCLLRQLAGIIKLASEDFF